MTKSFSALKRKYFFRAVITACAVGALCALAVTGILLLSLRLSKTPFFWAFYVLIALGVFALVGGGAFLLLRPTDEKIAKELDKTYALGQKVQTMVEFSGKEGDLISLQREDASARIAKLSPKKRSPLFFLRSALVCVLCCALFFTGIFIPVKADGPNDEDLSVITDWQERALVQLIYEVRDSSLKETVKEAQLVSLNGLREVLKQEHTAGETREAVRSAMELSVSLAEGADSYRDIGGIFSASENFKSFGEAIEQGAKCYGSKKDLVSFEAITGRLEAINDAITIVFSSSTQEIEARIADTNQLTGIPTIRAEGERLKEELEKANAWKGDGLYGAIEAYSAEIVKVADAEGQPLAVRRENVKTAGDGYKSAASAAVFEQVYTEMTCEYVRRRLASIFSIKIDSEEQGDNNPAGGNNSDDEDNPSQSGGAGNENVKYGGDDIIYDTRNGVYTEYGAVISEYYAAVTEILERDESLSEEVKQLIREYFNVLYRGFEGEESAE